MKWLLRTREVFRAFYAKYSTSVDRLARFALSLVAYLAVFYFAGYNATLSKPIFAVALALVSAFLPTSSTAVITALLLAIEFASVSIEIPVITLILFALILLLYFVFRAETAWLLVFTMVACLFGVSPAVLPMALLISPVDVIVLAFGVLIYGLVAAVRKDVSVFTSGSLTLGGRVNLLLTDILSDPRFLLILIGIVCASLLICIVRTSKRNYSGLIAIVLGDLLYTLLLVLGGFFLDVTISIPGLLIGLVLNAVFSFILLFVVRSLDYKRTEEVRFEDDDYFYFVKAVPKTVIRATERKESVITSSNPETINVDDLFHAHNDTREEKP